MRRHILKAILAPCMAMVLFLTGIPGSAPAAAKAQVKAAIPSSASLYKGHYYKAYRVTTAIDFLQAEANCESLGGHLVTITSKGENEFVAKLIKGMPAYNAATAATRQNLAWIGGLYKNGRARWITGEKMSFVGNNNPPNKTYIYSCMRNDGHWYRHQSSGMTKYFICEWDTDTSTVLPDQVENLTVRKASSNAVTLSWKKVSSAEGYAIYMKTGIYGSYKEIKNISGRLNNSMYKKNLKRKQVYYFRVRAYKTIYGQRSYGELSKPVGIYLP